MGQVAGHECLGHLGEAAGGRRGPELVDQLGAQHTRIDAEGACEAHGDDLGNRHHRVAQPHARAVGLGEHLDVGIAAERHEMVDRLAHVRQRERVARSGLDQRQRFAIGHRRTGRVDAYIGDAAAEQAGNVGAGRRRQHHKCQQRDGDPDQNVTRLRTSSA